MNRVDGPAILAIVWHEHPFGDYPEAVRVDMGWEMVDGVKRAIAKPGWRIDEYGRVFRKVETEGDDD